MRGYGREENKTSVGHICNGGGASIVDSPVTINFVVNVFAQDDDPDLSIIQKVLKSLGVTKNEQKQIATIEIPSSAIDADVQGQLVRAIADGPYDSRIG